MMPSPDIDCEITVQRKGQRVFVEIDCGSHYNAMQLVDGMSADMDKLGHTCLVIGQGAISHDDAKP